MKSPRLLSAVFGIALLASAAQSLAAPSPSLCRADEQVLFGCRARAKVISVCASKAFSPVHGYVQYRYGDRGRTEMTYPDFYAPPSANFYFSSTGYSGGGEAHLRFSNNGYDYIVYDKNTRGRDVGEGNYAHNLSAGVLVRRGGRTLSNIRCDADQVDAAIAEPAYRLIERESFDEDLVP